MMKFFTSRYTAALEQQIIDLKADKARLEATNARQADMIAELSRRPAEQVARLTPSKEDKEPPRMGSWVRLKESLEVASDEKHVNYPPAPERQRKSQRNEA